MTDRDAHEATRDPELAMLLGVSEPEIALPKRHFKPWHRPRKQYVRSSQWLREILDLADDIDFADGPFKYLTLPGEDLLDIRFLHDGFCLPRGLNLRYLGFSRSAQPGNAEHAVFTANQAALRLLENVDQASNTLYCDLSAIGVHKSMARQEVKKGGAFHAINIDLCDGFASAGVPTDEANLFKSLDALLAIQSRANRDSLVFLTSRIDGEQVAEELRSVFDGLIGKNLGECEGFASAVASEWLGTDSATPEDVARLDEDDRFLLGFTKWVISTALKYHLATSLRSVLTYRLKPDAATDDLVSIAFRLSPIHEVGPDPHGITGVPDPAPEGGWECALASKIPPRISHRRSVDERLNDDAELLEQCCRETEQLLEAVGYVAADYRDWIVKQI